MIRVDTCGINARIGDIVQNDVRLDIPPQELREQRPDQTRLTGTKEPSNQQKWP